MAGAHHDGHGVEVEDVLLQAFALAILGQAAENNVDVAGAQAGHQPVDRSFGHRDRDPRTLFPQPRQGARQQRGRGGQQGADMDAARKPFLKRLQFFACMAQLGQDQLGVLDQHLAEIRRGHAARGSIEQLDAQGVFQLLDALGRGGLGDVQRLRSLEDGALVGDRRQQAQLAQLQPPQQEVLVEFWHDASPGRFGSGIAFL
ncbi:hypothetical protein D3C85_1263360 [compost metagenome]